MKWQYKTVSWTKEFMGLDLDLLQTKLTLLGQDGWELVDTTPTVCIFKRQGEEDTKALLAKLEPKKEEAKR